MGSGLAMGFHGHCICVVSDAEMTIELGSSRGIRCCGSGDVVDGGEIVLFVSNGGELSLLETCNKRRMSS
jgi:hypothetical protein